MAILKAGIFAKGECIEGHHIEATVAATRIHTVFELTDAIGSRNLAKASHLLRNILDGGEHGLMVLTIMAPRMVDTLKLYMMAIFSQIGSMTITADSFPAHFARFMTMAGTCILPVMAAAVVAGLISGGMQSKFRISPKALKPKFSKLSPLKGFKNIFSSRSLVKLGTTLAKLVVIFGLTWPVIMDTLRNPIFYTTLDLSHLLIFMGETMQTVFLRVLVGMIIIAAVDYSYQMWKHEQDSMMTKEEVKEENKNIFMYLVIKIALMP